MTDTPRKEVVTTIMSSLLMQTQARFPSAVVIDKRAIAAGFGIVYAVKTAASGKAEETDPTIAGESFSKLVDSCTAWLAAEGYVRTSEKQMAVLTARGAKLMNCMPKALDERD